MRPCRLPSLLIAPRPFLRVGRACGAASRARARRGASASDRAPRVAHADLRELIADLDKRGQLRRVTAPVSRDLEIAEITDRVSKGPGDRNLALLFENVAGFTTPVLINAFGSEGRMATALGVERLDVLSARVSTVHDLRLP